MSRLLWKNPVLLRELQERVHSRRTAMMVTFWVALLCLIVALYYSGEVTGNLGGGGFGRGGNVLRLARVGQNMFDWLLFSMIGLVLFLVPGFTAASIAGERERQTLLPMQVTLLRPIDIVVGKVAASVVFVLILLAVTTPILAFAYVIGGITISEVFVSLAMMVFSALAIACITVACSAVVRRVPAAIVTAYGVVLALTLGSLAVFGVVAAIDQARGFDQANPPLTILAVNPVVAIADVSGDAPTDFYGAETPLEGLRELVSEFGFEDQFIDGGFVVEDFGGPVPVPPPPGFEGDFFEAEVAVDIGTNPNVRTIDRALPYLAQYMIVMTTLSGLAIWVASRRVRTPAKVER